ncbi:aspartate ammonia-lyase [Convivina intestini]|uniref:aspartate ammonia-lyase n=1 Tax=Convivina intestini TaxID=1505726 RepID=UPI0020107421|nr:aspartate ammonia-lyase [Convivina intestini]CAH1851536.1 Aspartate ammonia-lyase [Convivina intestini]
MRIETDSLGSLAVPDEARYGIHTQRALNNFPISQTTTKPALIAALIEIKQAAAKTNVAGGTLASDIGQVIQHACQKLLDQPIDSADFPIGDIQGGAGTSTNMNANEVVANVALSLLDEPKGAYQRVHPNDHVNMGQSTNDTYPSAGKIALIRNLQPLLTELEALIDALAQQAELNAQTYKMGRTQLQDAVPMTLGNTFHAWLVALKRDLQRIGQAQAGLYTLNLGGSAIGSGINVSQYYQEHMIDNLVEITGLPLRQAEDLFDATSNLDSFLALSAALKSLATNLSKFAADLRLMSSGPRSGLHEINLPAKQAGSSIMPGKVNPVIPEVVSQVAFEVIGFDATITAAVAGGQLELNAFEPIIFKSLFTGIEHLTAVMATFRVNAIEGLVANKEQLQADIHFSISFATAMVPLVGYQKAAELAKQSLKNGQSLHELAENSGWFSPNQMKEIFNVERLVKNGRQSGHGLVFDK